MKSIELFAGIGGIALAAEWAGIETVAFCEREPFCQKVLNKHWPDVPIFDDVCTLNKRSLEESGVDVGTIELISGGFPCQPYSIAGKQRGKEDDRDLWPEMFRIIKEIRPTWVVGENVANFVNMELDRTLFDLESIGYTCQSFVIPACAVDAKHERKRTFVVACSQRMGWEKGAIIQRENGKGRESDYISNSGEMVADSSIKRRNKVEQYDRRRKDRERAIRSVGKRSIQCRRDASRWEPEPELGRVAYGIPDRVDRIKGLGNAVVPQQIYPIFEAIKRLS